MTTDAATIEERATQRPPGFTHPEWAGRFPWLVQGTTGRGEAARPYDLGLFAAASPAARVSENWTALRNDTGMPRAVHAHQVHGAAVRLHHAGPPGLHVADPCDGHATSAPGVLLAVTVADCVPVFVVDPRRRAVALLHAGWRGAAQGILEAGLRVLTERMGSTASDLEVHLGPSICGSCYEVGPEVFAALGLAEPDEPAPLDLRAALADRAATAGVPRDGLTVSDRCTLCGPGLFSHRGGRAERQVGYLGVRP